jgi:signal transduction histidine kinase
VLALLALPAVSENGNGQPASNRGKWSAAEQEVERLRARLQEPPASTDPSAEQPLRFSLGVALRRCGRWADAELELERAQGLASQLGDAAGEVESLLEIVDLRVEAGRLEDALEEAERGLALAEQLEWPPAVYTALIYLGVIHDGLSDAGLAVHYFDEALECMEALEDPREHALALSNLAAVYLNLGDYERATQLLEDAQSRVDPENSAHADVWAAILSNFGDIEYLQENFEQALDFHKEALEFWAKSGDQSGLALGHTRLGQTYFQLEDGEAALRHLREATAIHAGLPPGPDAAQTAAEMARVLVMFEDEEAALEEAQEGMERARATNLKTRQVDALRAMAEVQEALENFPAALAAERQARELEVEIWSQWNQDEIAEFERRYDDDQLRILELEQEQALKEAELDRQRLAVAVLLLGSLLLAGAAWIGWGRVRAARRARRDLEEQQRAERRRRERRHLESLGRLAGGVAHDFNNLLTGILGSVGLARESASRDPKLGRLLEGIEETSGKAAALARQLLVYSGRARFRPEPVDLNALVEEVCAEFSSAAPEGVRVARRLDPARPRVLAEAESLRGAVAQVLHHSAQALGRGGGSVEVCTGRRTLAASRRPGAGPGRPLRAGRYGSIEIADHGPGMDQQALDQAFEPAAPREGEGLELGLALVRAILEGHRGGFTLKSSPGRGTRYTMLLPCVEAEAEGPGEPGPVPEERDLAGRAMLVDDNDMIRRTLARMLESFGLEVVEARSGQASLELLAGSQCDYVLLDLSMPGLSGWETLARLRELDADVPVVLMSGYEENGAEHSLGDDPRAIYLTKPFRVDELRAALREIGGRRPGTSGVR